VLEDWRGLDDADAGVQMKDYDDKHFLVKEGEDAGRHNQAHFERKGWRQDRPEDRLGGH
jgi:hypothetical protein